MPTIEAVQYKADITAGALKVPESRVIADLLLRGVNDEGWAEAIVRENVLQARSPKTAKRLTLLIRGRLETMGPDLGAVVTVTRDLALEQARAADREIAAGRWRGPLHGIPYGAKDLLATKGIPTTWGAEPYREQVFDHDATAIERLREAGAVLLGKLAMVELAGGLGYNNPDASFTGPGRTPWNRDRWSGGGRPAELRGIVQPVAVIRNRRADEIRPRRQRRVDRERHGEAL